MSLLRGLLLILAAHLVVGAELRTHGRLSFRAHQPSNAAAPLPSVHFIYTTGCNDYQLAHSVVLDHSWRAAGNRGRLTRIVADCRSPEARELLSRSPLSGSPDFSVFLAEGDLDHIPTTGERYPARSRPHAIEQWIATSPPSESVVSVVDPDFVFLRSISQHPSLAKVRRGRMVSSSNWWFYGDTSNSNITRDYKTGPVWLIDTSDLKTLLPDWKKLTDSWPKVGDGLMREQFAFQASAQKHRVPAVFVDDLATELMNGNEEPAPCSLHYFRSYNYARWGFHKSLASSGWYADHFNNSVPPATQCGAPLLQEPPPPPLDAPPEALTLFALLPRMNAAFKAYREAYCPGEAEAFGRRGTAAFGLARLMHPISCAGRSGEITRYRVLVEQPAAWDTEQALGGDRCSRQAQMLREPARVPKAVPHVLLQYQATIHRGPPVS